MQHSKSDAPGARPYRSPLRQRQAEQTRTAVCRAAAPLFARQGYTRTSLRQVASAAEVSVETVNTLGGKATVFLRSFELAFMGATEGAAMLEMDAMAPASAADTLEGFVDVMTDVIVAGNQRTAGLWAAYVEAANTDADLAAAYAARMQEMRVDGRRVLEAMVGRGLCPAPADPQDTVDRIWVLVHPSQYLLLVDHAGWDQDRYSAWMREGVLLLLRG